MTTNSPRTIQSVDVSLDIILTLQELDGATVTEIANHMGLSKGTIYCHLATLMAKEFVVKDDFEYRLSLRYLTLGEYVRKQVNYVGEIKEEIGNLQNATGELVHFVVEEYGYAIALFEAGGELAIDSPVSIGDREHLHCSAAGKAILANLPRARTDEIIDRHGLPAKTSETITSRDRLYDELAQIKEDGHAYSVEERVSGLCSIGTPVMRGGEVFGALSVVGPVSRFQAPRTETVLPNQISQYSNILELSIN